MIAFLTALAEALPAAGKFLDAVTHHDDKASTAAKVATDPNAPADVKQAAAAVAGKAIDDKAAAEKSALAAATGGKARVESGASSTLVLVGVGLLLLAGKRRR